VEAMTLADRLVVMHDGVAEQIDTPMAVYSRPATTYVAGFIGSPAMNMLQAEAAGNRGLVLANNAVVKPRGSRLPEAGRKVILGVRPEHLALVATGNADLELDVIAIETLGADTLAHGRLPDAVNGGGDLVARLPGSVSVKPGERLPLAIEPGMAHLFDAETGARLKEADLTVAAPATRAKKKTAAEA